MTGDLADAGPSGDPYFDDVSFLMADTEVQNANNNEIRGADGYSRTLTPQGGQIVQGTVTPYGDQGSSGLWSGDAWLLPNNPWEPATRNITIECWVKTPYKIAYQTIIGTYDGTNGWGFCIDAGGKVVFFINSNVVKTGTTDVCDDEWHHIAVCRNASSWRLFVDGAIDLEFSNGSYLSSPAQIRVGSLSAALPRMLKGFFTDIRYTDSMVYWNPFTPPTEPLLPSSYTAVLTDFSRAGIYDVKGNVNLYTAYDTAVDTNAIRTKFPPSSVWIGSTSHMQGYPANEALNLGSADYTIEGWFRFESNNEISLFELTKAGNNRVGVLVQPRTQISIYAHSFTPVVFPVTFDDLVTDGYYHIALSKSANVTRVFVDGKEMGSTPDTLSGDYDVLTFGKPKTGLNYFAGQIDGFRITKGIGRYISDFVPPTGPFPILGSDSDSDDVANPDWADVSLLARGNSEYYPQSLTTPDSGWYKHPVTSISTPVNTYVRPGTKGCSVFLKDGNSYLKFNTVNVPSFQLSSTQMTIEAWVYPTSVGGSAVIIRTSQAASIAKGFALTMNASRQVSFVDYWGTAKVVCTTTESIPLNAWTHVAALFNSKTVRICINGGTTAAQGSGNATTYAPAQGFGQVGGGWAGYVFGAHINKKRRYDYVNGYNPSPNGPPTNNGDCVLSIPGQSPYIMNLAGGSFMGTTGGARQIDTETNHNATSLSFGLPKSQVSTLEYDSEYTFGTGDFTIECWAYLTSAGGSQMIVDYRSRTGNRGLRPTLYIASGKINFYNGAVRISSESLAERTNQWMHIALCRRDGITELFIDGTQEGEAYIDDTDYLGPEDAVHIGGLVDAYNVQGYLDDVRICKNFAVYRGDFTPPTSAFPTE
jgi:hypothetical protein